MVPMRSWCLAANSSSWGRRAMVPSSFMISTISAAGSKPAMRARSTPASVCPARRKTPPGLATSGKMAGLDDIARAGVGGHRHRQHVCARCRTDSRPLALGGVDGTS